MLTKGCSLLCPGPMGFFEYIKETANKRTGFKFSGITAENRNISKYDGKTANLNPAPHWSRENSDLDSDWSQDTFQEEIVSNVFWAMSNADQAGFVRGKCCQ